MSTRPPGFNSDDIVEQIVAVLEGLEVSGTSGWSVTLHQSDDPFDPTESARVAVNGAFVVLVGSAESGRGIQALEPAPFDEWMAGHQVEIICSISRDARRDVQRDNLYKVPQAIVDSLSAKFLSPSLVLPMEARRLVTPRPVAGKGDFIEYRVQFRMLTLWRATE